MKSTHDHTHTPTLCSGPTSRMFRRQWLAWLGVAAATAGLAGCDRSEASTDVVSLELARAEHEAGRALLIDIREPEEHATGVAKGARLLPMRQLGRRLAEIPTDPQQPVLLICNTQNRSSATLRALRERGYGHVRYVNGGMSEWARRGWPMVKPTAGPGT
jgi:rhodanese-related sulfurtransferase